MIVTFEKEYLQELYVRGKTSDKKHRFQPEVIARYIKVVNTMKNVINVLELARLNGLHYEHLRGDKNGYSSVRVNDKYRIEFVEKTVNNQTIATVCNITELSNHYK
ncbi:MAG: type II toxin-antitoxin system RelE/ParE family toxin [Bacteroidales bacterium]|nr:type II toxin-antitoxin system RelE/ParE family toxin [Bacteroidales bacterium]